MCGRYSLTSSSEAIAAAFALKTLPPVIQRYNISPSQPIAVIRNNLRGTREFTFMLWGLIPVWAKALDDKWPRPINARAETIAEKKMFKGNLRHRRCLIPADGFYEWQKDGKRKRPHHIHLENLRPFAFAGIWSTWMGPNGEELESCTIVTQPADAIMSPIHHRMPVILSPEAYDRWLDTQDQSTKVAVDILKQTERQPLIPTEVSTAVNNPKHDGADCLSPLHLVNTH